MWNEPEKERLDKIPRLYETENVPLKDKLVWLHFFVGSCDWYVIETDGEDLFWGFACLGDLQNAEFGYFSLKGLKSIKVHGWLEIDCELEEHWKVRPAKEVELIRKANGWNQESIKCNPAGHPLG